MSADISDEEAAKSAADLDKQIRGIIEPARTNVGDGGIVSFNYKTLYDRVSRAVVEAESETILRVALGCTQDALSIRVSTLEGAVKCAIVELEKIADYSGSAGNWPLHDALTKCRKALDMPPTAAVQSPTAPDHDWRITSREYDDTFFHCRNCGRETSKRRGMPPATAAECIRYGEPVCTGKR